MELIGSIARKTGDAALLRVEAEKTRLGSVIGTTSRTFRVPQIIELNETGGILDFERIPSLTTLTEMLIKNEFDIADGAHRLGRALAHIHLELDLDPSMHIPLPSEWGGQSESNVALHGDFTANNICVDRSDGALIIVDWSSAPLVGRSATVGPACFDVSWFVRHLIMGAPTLRVSNWPATAFCDVFIKSYTQGIGSPIERDIWKRHHTVLDPFARDSASRRSTKGHFLFRRVQAIAQQKLYARWKNYEPPPGTLTD